MVVIAIIAMLIGLLLPAVQSSIGRARQTTCLNHCDQIQLAIAQFAMSKDRLPYLVTTLPGNPPAAGSTNYVTAGWVPQILSHLDRNDLYQIYVSNATAGGSVYNADGKSVGPAGYMFIQYIDLLLCPADTAKPMTALSATAAGGPAKAPLSYAANAGSADLSAPYTDTKTGIVYPPDYQENGVFFNQAASLLLASTPQAPITTDMAYISKNDGKSTTILFGENMDAGYWAQYWGYTEAPVSFVPFVPYQPSSNGVGAIGPNSYEDPQALLWQDLPDSGLTQPTIGLNQSYNGLRPGEIGQLIGTPQSPPQGAVARPSSAHPGGFLITYCDGHSAYMSQDVSYQIYAALMTPRGTTARLPGSGPYVAGSNPSPPLQNWQTTPISAESLTP
jgi:type II secretory pathway pseudopilin PulG